MFRFVGSLVLGVCAMVLIGCSGFDSTEIAVHPDSVAAGSAFDVVLLDNFIYIDSTKTVSADIKRDSLHLAVGLPASWNIAGAQCVRLSSLTKEQKMKWLNEELSKEQLAALLASAQAAAVTMTADDAVATAVKAKTITAHGDSDEIVPVSSASAAQWKGFSVPVNISLSKGTAMDSVLDFDTLMNMAGDTAAALDTETVAMLKMLGYTIPDSLGVLVTPVAVFLKVIAGPQVGRDTLFYFTKTGSLKKSAGAVVSPFAIPDMDTGDMAFKPITILGAQAVRSGRSVTGFAGVNIFTDRMSGTVRIDLGQQQRTATFVDIYSLRGDLVKRLTPSASIIWNGTDQMGSRVGAGSYLVKVAGNSGMVTRSVQLMR
jgi:hypothetical protein